MSQNYLIIWFIVPKTIYLLILKGHLFDIRVVINILDIFTKVVIICLQGGLPSYRLQGSASERAWRGSVPHPSDVHKTRRR